MGPRQTLPCVWAVAWCQQRLQGREDRSDHLAFWGDSRNREKEMWGFVAGATCGSSDIFSGFCFTFEPHFTTLAILCLQRRSRELGLLGVSRKGLGSPEWEHISCAEARDGRSTFVSPGGEVGWPFPSSLWTVPPHDHSLSVTTSCIPQGHQSAEIWLASFRSAAGTPKCTAHVSVVILSTSLPISLLPSFSNCSVL